MCVCFLNHLFVVLFEENYEFSIQFFKWLETEPLANHWQTGANVLYIKEENGIVIVFMFMFSFVSVP